jgi:hypothetical protein
MTARGAVSRAIVEQRVEAYEFCESYQDWRTKQQHFEFARQQGKQKPPHRPPLPSLFNEIMASLVVPAAYLAVLVVALLIFGRFYKKRVAGMFISANNG